MSRGATRSQALLLDAENALRQFDRPAAIAKLRQALTIAGATR